MMSNKELIERIDARIEYWSIGLPSTSKTIELLADCREALTRKYVPMTDDEIEQILSKRFVDYDRACCDLESTARAAEAEVIRRAGLEVQND